MLIAFLVLFPVVLKDFPSQTLSRLDRSRSSDYGQSAKPKLNDGGPLGWDREIHYAQLCKWQHGSQQHTDFGTSPAIISSPQLC